MKEIMKYMAGATVGIGMYMLYEKVSPMLMKNAKKAVDTMSKELDKCEKTMEN